jgi:hypothetical protein
VCIRYVGKDVSEPLLCALQGEEDTAEQSAQIIVKDNILAFSRQNSKLCAAEADFERLLKNKDETSDLFKLLCEGGSGASLLKIEVLHPRFAFVGVGVGGGCVGLLLLGLLLLLLLLLLPPRFQSCHHLCCLVAFTITAIIVFLTIATIPRFGWDCTTVCCWVTAFVTLLPWSLYVLLAAGLAHMCII